MQNHSPTESSIPTHSSNAKSWQILLALICTYVVFAMLLNSVGTVILQSIASFAVSKTQASTLEGFKDLPIAIVSFFVASYLPKIGYKRAMLTALGIVTIACVLMPLVVTFLMTKMMFLSLGISFALVKVCTYSLIGKVSSNATSHASNMNILEGCFMVGVLVSYWLFALFIDPSDPASTSWLSVYWLLAGISALAALLLLSTPIPEEQPNESNQTSVGLAAMLKLVWLPFVMMFVICAFLYVLIEQGIGTWLPTFNNSVLNLANHISVQITSIFAACLAIGRLSAGYVLRKLNWFPFLMLCLVAMMLLLLLVMPLAAQIDNTTTVTSWQNVPLVAWLLPLVGLFMAPIYPAINSVVLSALPSHQHASMTGLIVIFSALGGTLGSLVTGTLFDHFDGQTAFYFLLIPMLLLAISMIFYKRIISRSEDSIPSETSAA